MATSQKGMRLTVSDLDVIEALRRKLGILTMIDVVRLALRRLAELEKVKVIPQSRDK
jgi:hypothetical protein